MDQLTLDELVITVDLGPIKCINYADMIMRIEVYYNRENRYYYPKSIRTEKFIMRRGVDAASSNSIEGVATRDYKFSRPEFIRESASEVIEAVIAYLG